MENPEILELADVDKAIRYDEKAEQVYWMETPVSVFPTERLPNVGKMTTEKTLKELFGKDIKVQ